MPTADHLHRREFALHVLGGWGALMMAAENAGSAPPPPPSLPEDPPSAPAEQTPPVELLMLSALVRNYPSEHYSDDVLRGIYGDIAGDVARGKQLRGVTLQNSDEPACVFRVVRNTFVEGNR